MFPARHASWQGFLARATPLPSTQPPLGVSAAHIQAMTRYAENTEYHIAVLSLCASGCANGIVRAALPSPDGRSMHGATVGLMHGLMRRPAHNVNHGASA